LLGWHHGSVNVDPALAEGIRKRHDDLTGRLRRIAEDNGHDPERLNVVGVTKTHPVEVVRAALTAGIKRLGESRVQEAEPKIQAVPEAEWHFIGQLQSNKARRAVRAFAVIHSVDAIELLRRIDEIAAGEGRAPRILLQVNVSGEAGRAGMDPSALEEVEPPTTARLVGLMTIAPMHAGDEEARSVFAGLRGLRDALQERIGQALPELSMGMSADAEAAAAEGATLVRIGTALFGPRG
jgi:hypothetical protein